MAKLHIKSDGTGPGTKVYLVDDAGYEMRLDGVVHCEVSIDRLTGAVAKLTIMGPLLLDVVSQIAVADVTAGNTSSRKCMCGCDPKSHHDDTLRSCATCPCDGFVSATKAAEAGVSVDKSLVLKF